MSKHKFLFKHSVFYHNSKLSQFQTLIDSNVNENISENGNENDDNQTLREGHINEPLDPLNDPQLINRLNPDCSTAWNLQFSYGYNGYQNFDNNQDTYPVPDEGVTSIVNHHAIPPVLPYGTPGETLVTEGYPCGQSSNNVTPLTALTPAIVDPGTSGYFFDPANNKFTYNGYHDNEDCQGVQVPGASSGASWTFPQDYVTSYACETLPCHEPANSRDTYEKINSTWNIPSQGLTSHEVYSSMNIASDNVDPEEIQAPPMLEPKADNTTSVIKTSNRVGVITKAPANTAKHLAVSNDAETSRLEIHHTSITNPNIIIHPGNIIMYECKVCGRKFKSKNNCKYHLHDSSKTRYPYVCEHCGKGMFASTHYRYHLLTHSGEREHKCPTCSKGFLTARKLERHMLIHNKEKSEKCDECDKRFHTVGELRQHQLTHNKGATSHLCMVCGKKFAVLSQLKYHESTHTGQHKFACETCGKTFQRLKHLQNHQLIHMGTKPFRCDRCIKCFRTEASLAHHTRTHDDDRPYRCETCGRSFVLQKDYNRHQNVHTGEASFACTQCERTFRRKDNLIRHNKIYHLEGKRTNEEFIYQSM